MDSLALPQSRTGYVSPVVVNLRDTFCVAFDNRHQTFAGKLDMLFSFLFVCVLAGFFP